MEMCKVITPYLCSKCGQPTLFFVCDNGRIVKLIDYKMLIDRGLTRANIYKVLAVRHATSVRCINCNEENLIDWSNGYPIQLNNIDILNKFKKT